MYPNFMLELIWNLAYFSLKVCFFADISDITNFLIKKNQKNRELYFLRRREGEGGDVEM